MIDACRTQLRVSATGRPFAVDFAAVLALGAARGVDLALLADVLPDIEPVLVASMIAEGDDG